MQSKRTGKGRAEQTNKQIGKKKSRFFTRRSIGIHRSLPLAAGRVCNPHAPRISLSGNFSARVCVVATFLRWVLANKQTKKKKRKKTHCGRAAAAAPGPWGGGAQLRLPGLGGRDPPGHSTGSTPLLLPRAAAGTRREGAGRGWGGLAAAEQGLAAVIPASCLGQNCKTKGRGKKMLCLVSLPPSLDTPGCGRADTHRPQLPLAEPRARIKARIVRCSGGADKTGQRLRTAASSPRPKFSKSAPAGRIALGEPGCAGERGESSAAPGSAYAWAQGKIPRSAQSSPRSSRAE